MNNIKAFKAWLQNLDLPFIFVKDLIKAEKEEKTPYARRSKK